MTVDPSIFREYDIRGVYPSTLNEYTAEAIGVAFARTALAAGGNRAICVGYDGRKSSPVLKDALIKGICSAGANALEVGRGPTPMLYYAVCTTPHVAGGIMITGSHNPPDHNGFKFMLGTQPFFGEAIQGLRPWIEQGSTASAHSGTTDVLPVQTAYVAALAEAYPTGGKALRVAWDAGNGAAGEVMAQLAAKLPGEHFLLNATIDGTFPVHHPDPTVVENLQQLIGEVKARGCDVGIAFDGDGDRIGVVDGEGEILWGDQLLALYAADVLAKKPGATVIADVKASQALFDEITRLGGKPLLWKTGHSHIKAKMKELSAPLAGEMSGHMFFADRYFGFDDALYAAVRLLGFLAQRGISLTEFRRSLPQTVSTPEIRFPCDETRKFNVIKEVKQRLKMAGAQFIDVDGVRVQTPDGWWLLRASNTQAMLSARLEARDAAGLKRLESVLSEALSASGIQLPQLKAA